MAGGHNRGDLGEVRRAVQTHRTRRVAAVGLMLAALGSIAVLAYDHRRADLSTAWTALPDGRGRASVDSAGRAGPQSVVVVGRPAPRCTPCLRCSVTPRRSGRPARRAVSQ